YKVVEGDDNKTMNLIVQRSGSSSVPTSVTVKTIAGGTATSADYVALNKVVTIPAGQNTLNVPFTIKGDNLSEGDETVKVQLSVPSYGVVGTQGTTTVTIADDEAPPFRR